jgi:N utilization substance protein B
MPVRAETRQRALALQLLYAWDLLGAPPETPETTWHRMLALVRSGTRVEDAAVRLAAATVARRGELDDRIRAATDRWRVERLGVVDRNVLRLALLELTEGAVPTRVVLDEAVRLARWFGGPKSPGFVNGVLDRAARDLGRL